MDLCTFMQCGMWVDAWNAHETAWNAHELLTHKSINYHCYPVQGMDLDRVYYCAGPNTSANVFEELTNRLLLFMKMG